MNNVHPIFNEILSGFTSVGDTLTKAEKRRDDRYTRIFDLESILADLKTAHATAELQDDLSDLADEIDALWAKFSNKLAAAEAGE